MARVSTAAEEAERTKAEKARRSNASSPWHTHSVDQLQLFVVSVQVRIGERRADQPAQLLQPFGDLVVLGDVALCVAVDKTQVRLAAQFDGTHAQAFQVGLWPVVAGEQQLVEAPF